MENFVTHLRRIADSDLAMSRDEYREAADRIEAAERVLQKHVVNPDAATVDVRNDLAIAADNLMRWNPDAETDSESFPGYLQRVGSDYRESGNDATAEDYEEAAGRIEDAAQEIESIAGEIRPAAFGLRLRQTADRLRRR